MISQNQTDFTFTTGDCMRACVASILELTLQQVPNFMKDGSNKYYENIQKWFLEKTSFLPLDVEFKEEGQDREWLKDCICVAVGKSPRAKKDGEKHGVVWLNGEMVHDPHPDKTGLAEYPTVFTVFIKRNAGFNNIGDSNA